MGYSSFLRMILCLIFTTAKLSSISVSEVAVVVGARILFRENFRHVKGFGKIKRIILEVVSLQFFTADFFAPFLHQPLSQLHDYKVLINLSV